MHMHFAVSSTQFVYIASMESVIKTLTENYTAVAIIVSMSSELSMFNVFLADCHMAQSNSEMKIPPEMFTTGYAYMHIHVHHNF